MPQAQGDYVAKQKVTLWNYGNGGTTLIPYNVPEKAQLEVIVKCSHFFPLRVLFPSTCVFELS